MSDAPGSGGGAGTRPRLPAEFDGKPLGENAFLKFVQRPRILLIILALWSILSVLTEAFTQNGLFMDNHNVEIDGAIGGLAFGWQGIPLAVLYVYCVRDPVEYHRVFWLALIHMAAITASQPYHWLVTDDFTFESIVVPMGVSAFLGTIVFIHLFQPREKPPLAATPPAQAPENS